MEDLFRRNRKTEPTLQRSETVLVAKCKTGRHVLRGGLGALGVGRMWFRASAEDEKDELWEELPTEECVPFGIGDPCSARDAEGLVEENRRQEARALQERRGS